MQNDLLNICKDYASKNSSEVYEVIDLDTKLHEQNLTITYYCIEQSSAFVRKMFVLTYYISNTLKKLAAFAEIIFLQEQKIKLCTSNLLNTSKIYSNKNYMEMNRETELNTKLYEQNLTITYCFSKPSSVFLSKTFAFIYYASNVFNKSGCFYVLKRSFI